MQSWKCVNKFVSIVVKVYKGFKDMEGIETFKYSKHGSELVGYDKDMGSAMLNLVKRAEDMCIQGWELRHRSGVSLTMSKGSQVVTYQILA